jgi:hypothetical protein
MGLVRAVIDLEASQLEIGQPCAKRSLGKGDVNERLKLFVAARFGT